MEAGSCDEGKYDTGYGCRNKTIGQLEFCPIDEDNPPPRGERRCVLGGGTFWFIHVGGNRIDWEDDTDAMCLSVDSKPAAWGKADCQTADTEAACGDIFMYAGCATGWTNTIYICVIVCQI